MAELELNNPDKIKPRVKLKVAHGTHRGECKNESWTDAKLLRVLQNPSVDARTFGSYKKLDVDEKAKVKASSGYYKFGHYEGGIRKITHLQNISALAYDLDNATHKQIAYIINGKAGINAFRYFAHTTRSHSPENPRWRIIVPLTGPVDLEKANAVARFFALELAKDPDEAIEIPDQVSFRNNQIAYRPAHCRDQEYLVHFNDAHGHLLDPDDFLESLDVDWTDHHNLPTQEGEKSAAIRDPNIKKEHAHDKPGVIGAFNRCYPITRALDELIPGTYEEGDSGTDEARFTLVGASGRNGAVLYDDDTFLASNHGTDPIGSGGNAWDAVRIHKFGHLDDKAKDDTPFNKLPSQKAMEKFARDLDEVKVELVSARVDDFDDYDDEDDDEYYGADFFDDDESADSDDFDLDDLLAGDGEAPDEEDEDDFASKFEDYDDDEGDEEEPEPEKAKKKTKEKAADRWESLMTVNEQDVVEKTRHNAVVIFCNDGRISPCIAKNELSGAPYVLKKFHFKKLGRKQARIPPGGRKFSDVDLSAVSSAISAPKKLGGYQLDFTQEQLTTGMLQAAEKNSFNPVLDKINKTEWDGTPRVERFFINYLDATDDAYHREAALAWFRAAFQRLVDPGAKFDLVPILWGGQGIGKSGMIHVLGFGHYFGELSKDFHNDQRMVESMRGKWILEVAELSGFRLSEVEDIKKFFSRQVDTIRLAYRQNEEDFPRVCVFMGTSNKGDFLRDDTGNRRFLPVQVRLPEGEKIDFPRLKSEVGQLWAEAKVLYEQSIKAARTKDIIFDLESDAAKATALELQEGAREETTEMLMAEAIAAWLDEPVTAEVAYGGREDKFPDDEDDEDGGPTYRRDLISKLGALEDCPAQIVQDNRKNTRIASAALRLLRGWVPAGSGAVLRHPHLGAATKKEVRWLVREGTDGEPPFIQIARAGGDDLGLDD
ncbi:MAG TPA: hypothetical protein DEO85_01130 [Maritimibacter sp.]|nr:hypothetical protein [Maritimibacter sp.]